MARGDLIHILVCQIEFREGGDTIWVHSPIGATVLRIKTMGGKINVMPDCENACAHSDMIVKGDIDVCIPTKQPKLGKKPPKLRTSQARGVKQ